MTAHDLRDRAVDPERDRVFVRNVSRLEQLLRFHQSLARKDGALFGNAAVDLAVDHRQAMAVRGNHAHRPIVVLDVNAAQVDARFVERHRKERALDHRGELGGLGADLAGALGRLAAEPWDARKILRVQTNEVPASFAAHHLDTMILEALEPNRGTLHFLHELEELSRVDGHRSGALHLGLAGPAYADVEIGREHRDSALRRFDQDVRKNRQRVAPLDDSLGQPQTFEKLRAIDLKFHSQFSLEDYSFLSKKKSKTHSSRRCEIVDRPRQRT